MTELATRPLLGYPTAEISLLFDQGEITVVIKDHLGITKWEPSNGKEGLEMFNHPFAYGYEYPTINEYQGEDGA